jgi:CheY-like chemotaxis protein
MEGVIFICKVGAMVEGKYILYAEDDVDDQELLIEMMSKASPDLRVLCVYDGYDVLHFLENLQPGSRLPCIILLDINMPGLDGLQTLKLIKDHDTYKSIPVIIFSTSNSQKDKDTAMSLGAENFNTKPVKPEELDSIARHFASLCYTVPEIRV